MTQTIGDFGRSTIYRAEWRDGEDLERWLSRMAAGRTLCFPCRSMMWGDVRADIDPQHGPDVIADIRQPPFQRREFGTVYVDPPYSMCAYDEILQWLPEVWKCADTRLILNSPPVCAWLDGAQYRMFFERRPGSPHMALYHVYDRPDSQLSDFGGDE